MKLMLVGGGGREHALAWRILQSPLLGTLCVTHANPGFPSQVQTVTGDPVDWARANGVDLVVVGPEAPLAEGLSDRLRSHGIAVFGPSRAAAQLESSKAFAKAFMDRHGIPTAGWSVHTEAQSAHAAIHGPCVVKADGLAGGKGVMVAHEPGQAHAAVDEVFGGRFGAAGTRVLIEELLVGPEVSVLALCDGHRAVPLLPCRDHKRRFDGDKGPNTGGMGAVCPAPGVSQAVLDQIADTVLRPTVDGMAAEGMPFRGVLYAGLMLTAAGPRVLEFNVRFGDPECQPLMAMLDEDILPWLDGAARGSLPPGKPRWYPGAACCVVMVDAGYPGSVTKGQPIGALPAPTPNTAVFCAGVRAEGPQLLSDGGRVLGVTARAPSLDQARADAYRLTEQIDFPGGAYRLDIGGRAL